MEWQRGAYTITDDPQHIDVDVVYELLEESYWAAGRPRERMEKAMANSICLCLYHHKRQVGFARIVTDYATFAWICDVIIQRNHRHQGLGKWLMACVTAHSAIQGTQQLLKTRDAQALYEQFGFERGECMTRRS